MTVYQCKVAIELHPFLLSVLILFNRINYTTIYLCNELHASVSDRQKLARDPRDVTALQEARDGEYAHSEEFPYRVHYADYRGGAQWVHFAH
jgi:hypothetical protein